MMPTMESPAHRARTQRANSMLPIEALPNVNSLPAVSAMQNENQRRFAVRINWVWSNSCALWRRCAASLSSSSTAWRTV